MVIEGVGPFSTVAGLYLCLSNYMEKVWRSMKKMSLLGADLTWQHMAAVSDSSLLISGQRSPNPSPHDRAFRRQEVDHAWENQYCSYATIFTPLQEGLPDATHTGLDLIRLEQ